MESIIYLRQKAFISVKAIDISFIALILLFFTEISYYLLILQTGIVEYYHSDLSRIWMIPVGGVLGILGIYKLGYQRHIITTALMAQTALMLFYPHFNGPILFILGLSSGFIAPYLIFQLSQVKEVVIALGLAYLLGTFAITIPSGSRGLLAIGLSLTALFALQGVTPPQKPKNAVLDKGYAQLFLWLLLDAVLFESLSRSSIAIWAHTSYTPMIAFFHLIGLLAAYRFHNSKYNPGFILGLFFLSYLFFVLKMPYPLAVVYPIVISYYNVLVLKKFMTLNTQSLTIASLSLWISSGMGLFISLHHFI